MGQLRARMEQDLKLKGFSPATIRNYLLYCRKFAAFYMRSPEELGEAEVRSFLGTPPNLEDVCVNTAHPDGISVMDVDARDDVLIRPSGENHLDDLHHLFIGVSLSVDEM